MKRMTRKSAHSATRKQRRTFTLSADSVALLNDLRAEREGPALPSVSSILDSLLLSLNSQRKRMAIDQAITQYYDDLSEESREEDREWGDFSLTQFFDGEE